MQKKVIDIRHASSLGNYCFSASVLREIGIRKTPMPFDWVFTTPKTTAAIIEDDFQKFLDKKYYVDIAKKEKEEKKQAGHSLYHENFFNHKDPRQAEDYDYYLMCVDNFQNFLNFKNTKLFFCSYKNLLQKMDRFLVSDIFKLNNILSKKTSNYYLLCHINYPFNKKINYNIFNLNNIVFFEFYSLQYNDGLGYPNEKDEEAFYYVFNNLFNYVK